MKYSRELKVGVLAIVCLGILYFGFNFLKGINIFSPTKVYVGTFDRVNGLTAQAPVYIKGYKVGLVESIQYDFKQSPAFTVAVSIDKAIELPRGTEMALVADGLLGGGAIELQLPALMNRAMPYQNGDTLPTLIVPGLIDNLQTGLLAQLDSILTEANNLLASLNNEMEQGSLHATLQNVERITNDLTVSSKDIRKLTHNQLPAIMDKVDTTIVGLQDIVADVQAADIQSTISTLDSTIHVLNTALQSENGTLGLLLNDTELHDNLNTTLKNLNTAVMNVDTIIMSIKARPFIQK
ncbi:MAG: MCE family protein, partial [Paludibacteraceae bacterium]|nr:MCE family protein [Paludibacteraceae bacterium]